ncbi:MAG: triose-phosphate isomerase [Deltaproteobacteria bacterium]|nr:triose-phosphate isomerase [Deltaproteobacteria bacterium]
MRRWMIAGNWKMNKNIEESRKLAKDIVDFSKKVESGDIVIAPPFTALKEVYEVTRGSKVKLAAQNCHFEEKGAYTGEVSLPMLKDVGCTHVIIGHSERRKYFSESDNIVNKKIKATLKWEVAPILCVGETEEERDTGITEYVVGTQIKKALKGIEFSEKLVIAYEPVWAIGTGKNATPQQAQEVHKFIRDVLRSIYGEKGGNLLILYGGSVTPDNIGDLISMEDVDGVLVGGASLKSDSFIAIIEKTLELK